MSDSLIISQVSGLLRNILMAELQPPAVVEIASPVDQLPATTLSIWLYQVTPNAYLRNAPNVRRFDEDLERITPLTLDLYYLLTPSQAVETANQITLGSALQVLYDNSILTLQTGDNVEELHLNICQRSIEELAKVWEALQRPYRLSVCFEVRVVQIDSRRSLKAGPVRERETEFKEMPEEVEV
jgi:hypothetical protein